MNTSTQKIVKGIEFTLLFFGIPLILYFDSFIRRPSAVLLPVVIVIVITAAVLTIYVACF